MDYRKKFLVEPGAKVRLDRIDPSYTGKHESREEAAPAIAKQVARMDRLQYLPEDGAAVAERAGDLSRFSEREELCVDDGLGPVVQLPAAR
jgi:hypothetical protein